MDILPKNPFDATRSSIGESVRTFRRAVGRAEGSRGAGVVDVLFDSHACRNFVRRSVAEKLAAVEQLQEPFTVEVGGKMLTITNEVTLSVNADGKEFVDRFTLLDGVIEGVVIGGNAKRKNKSDNRPPESALQTAINHQCGVSSEVFARYNR